MLTVGSGIIHHYFLLYTFIYQILYNENILPKRNSNCYVNKKLTLNQNQLNKTSKYFLGICNRRWSQKVLVDLEIHFNFFGLSKHLQ